MILRWSTLLWLAAFAAAVGLLFQITHAVQDLETQLRATQEQIQRDREAVHVLRAEWSYLNRPDRIARLAAKHLDMVPLTAPNITRIAALPPRPEDMDGRTFASGPPTPPRRPGIELAEWRDDEAAPAARPEGAADPIGELVAATLETAAPEPARKTESNSQAAGSAPRQAQAGARAPQPVAEPLPRTLDELDRDVPRNPVTGAPLPVGTRLVSETR
jgi:cell division protein FtsL